MYIHMSTSHKIMVFFSYFFAIVFNPSEMKNKQTTTTDMVKLTSHVPKTDRIPR